MLAAARAKARELGPELMAADEARMERHLQRLLPFTREAVQTWASFVLDDCRALGLASASLTARFSALRSAERLEQVLSQDQPSKGLLDRLKRPRRLSASQREVLARVLRDELSQVLAEAQKLTPQVKEDGSRLATQLLALRAVSEAAGRPEDSSFELLVEQRRELLRAATAQMQMLPLQLKALKDTASLQHTQCEKFLNVTLPALALGASSTKL